MQNDNISQIKNMKPSKIKCHVGHGIIESSTKFDNIRDVTLLALYVVTV